VAASSEGRPCRRLDSAQRFCVSLELQTLSASRREVELAAQETKDERRSSTQRGVRIGRGPRSDAHLPVDGFDQQGLVARANLDGHGRSVGRSILEMALEWQGEPAAVEEPLVGALDVDA
jgi:hypothetical protein